MGPAKSSAKERGEERRGEKGWEAAEWPRAGRVETEFRKSSKKPEAVSCCYAATIDHLGGRRERERVRRRASLRPRTPGYREYRVQRLSLVSRWPCRARVTRRAIDTANVRRLVVSLSRFVIHRDSRIDSLTLIDRLPVPSRSGSWLLLLLLPLLSSRNLDVLRSFSLPTEAPRHARAHHPSPLVSPVDRPPLTTAAKASSRRVTRFPASLLDDPLATGITRATDPVLVLRAYALPLNSANPTEFVSLI